jgi:ankyrin repeat protein
MKQLLLSHGGDVNAQDKLGWTPLHHAAYEGHAEVVRLLLGHKADPTIRNQAGRTAREEAQRQGSIEVVALLHREEGGQRDARG